jgi:hypothetical protein
VVPALVAISSQRDTHIEGSNLQSEFSQRVETVCAEKRDIRPETEVRPMSRSKKASYPWGRDGNL